MEGAAFALFETPIGRCAIVWRTGRIIGSALPESSEVRMRAGLMSRFPGAAEQSPPLMAVEAIDLTVRLLSGERVDLAAIPVDLSAASPFEQAVYSAARSIACGEVRTYGQIAHEIGEPGTARSVGAALGRNPIPIIVPCHRVLASMGRSGGFSAPGGTATKFRILQIEGARRAQEPELFESLPLAVKPVQGFDPSDPGKRI